MLLKICWEPWWQMKKRWDWHVATVCGRLDKWSRTLREKVKRQYVQQKSGLENCICQKTLGQMDGSGLPIAVLLWLGDACYFGFAVHFLWASHFLYLLVCDCGLLLYMLPLRKYLIALKFLFRFEGDNEEKALLLPSPHTEGHKQQSALLLLLKQGSLKGFLTYKKT